jgi:hypothetical protein
MLGTVQYYSMFMQNSSKKPLSKKNNLKVSSHADIDGKTYSNGIDSLYIKGTKKRNKQGFQQSAPQKRKISNIISDLFRPFSEALFLEE